VQECRGVGATPGVIAVHCGAQPGAAEVQGRTGYAGVVGPTGIIGLKNLALLTEQPGGISDKTCWGLGHALSDIQTVIVALSHESLSIAAWCVCLLQVRRELGVVHMDEDMDEPPVKKVS
jgi:hypothetical protein